MDENKLPAYRTHRIRPIEGIEKLIDLPIQRRKFSEKKNSDIYDHPGFVTYLCTS